MIPEPSAGNSVPWARSPPPHIECRYLPPGYLRFSSFAFLLGVLYQRSLERLVPALRATLIVVARKSA